MDRYFFVLSPCTAIKLQWRRTLVLFIFIQQVLAKFSTLPKRLRAISENRTHDPFPTKEVLYP
jgi:hypothetical protein